MYLAHHELENIVIIIIVINLYSHPKIVRFVMSLCLCSFWLSYLLTLGRPDRTFTPSRVRLQDPQKV